MDGSSIGGRSLSSSLKSELEAIKSEMRADLKKQLDDMEKHWQACFLSYWTLTLHSNFASPIACLHSLD